MEFLYGPLRDSANPPARYALESDSEDEIGGGVYDGSKHLRKTQSLELFQFSMEGLKPVEGKQVTVAVGNSGLFLLSTLEKSNTDKSTISIDEVEIGSVSLLAEESIYLVAISPSLPNTVLHSLSKWILSLFKPQRLGIVDEYPVPAYISSTHGSPQVTRYLQTTPSTNHILPSGVKPFSPPNLLGTQTISSALLAEAQLSQISGRLPVSTILLLLPATKILPPPPKVTSTWLPQKLSDSAGWGDEELESVVKAFDIPPKSFKRGLGRQDSAGKQYLTGGQNRGRGDIGDGGMYI